MKLQKILLLVAALVLIKMDFALAQSTGIKTINASEFQELMKNKGAVRVIDVRTPGEVAEGHLPDAKNIDYQSDDFKSEIAKLDKKRTYLLYCKAGTRSAKAASIMKAAGFTHVYSLDGGIDAWKEAGKPIEK